MKVLLISANRLKTPYPVYPLGLDYVANAISAEHQVRLVDMNEMENNDPLAEVIYDFLPDVIGLSLRNIDNGDITDPKGYMSEYRELVLTVRGHSDALLVLGGSGFTLFPREIMEALEADYGIVGEGERLSLLLKAIEARKRTSGIPGVIKKGENGIVPWPWNGNLTRRFHEDSSYLQFYLKNGSMLNLQTKRGCNFKCIYCTYPHIEGNKLRLIPPGEVADAAVRIEETGAKYFFVTDSVFNGDYHHSIEVAHAFMRSGVSIPWGAFFAPTKPPEDYYRIMADAGLTHAEFGTESLSDDMLESYRKPFRVDDVFCSHEAARNAGLHVAHYFLLGGPGEDCDSIDKTLSNADNLEGAVLFIFCGIRIYPYTALYDIAVKSAKISETWSLLEPVFYESDAITNEEIILRVKDYGKEKTNWVVGSGGEVTAKIVPRMYARGYYGPLWEHLIRR
ncbi:MAG: cobalamin-dependent protein [Proteobacteria bacterium]|nr:cobalamin-dependent protein [Pseudomonadota bacterium]